MKRLLADIGGTNTRCAIQHPREPVTTVREFVNAEYDSLAAVLRAYIETLAPDERPDAGVLAIAAPVSGDRISMVNSNWAFSLADTRDQLALTRLTALNDFEALAWALPELSPSDLRPLGNGTAGTRAPKGILGPGTGLGVASLIPSGDGWVAVGGEGGHVTLAASNAEEAEVIERIRDTYGHCSAERVLSGPGLEILHRALHGGPELAAKDIAAHADAGDAAAATTLAMFFDFLGTVASNLALTIGAFGGIYIGGGIVPRHEARIARSGFRARFEAKGRYVEYLSRIPTWLITADNPTLTGLAAYAERIRAA